MTSLVHALSRLDQSERALQEASDALATFEAQDQRRGIAAALELLAAAHLAAGDYDQAQKAADRALTIFREELEDHLGESRTLRTVAALHLKRGKMDRATTLAEQAISRALDAGDVDEAARALREHTQLLLSSGKRREAAAVATRLRQAFRGTGEKAAEAAALLSAADIHWSEGEIKQCFSAAREAVQLLEGEVDPLTEAAALALCAKTQVELQDFHQARQYGRRARRHFAEAGDKQQEVAMRLLVGRACLMPDPRGTVHLKDALREAEEALALAAELNNRCLEAAGLTLAAEVYNVGSNPEAAMDAADRASQLFRKGGDFVGEATARVACATALLALDRLDEAWDEASRAIVLLEEGANEQLSQAAQRILETVEQRTRRQPGAGPAAAAL